MGSGVEKVSDSNAEGVIIDSDNYEGKSIILKFHTGERDNQTKR